MSNVEMMPISAYARAQNGSASGSLQCSTLNRETDDQLAKITRNNQYPQEQE